MNLQLNEILWEISPKCNRFGTETQCKFCGSTELKHCDELPPNKIIQIADNICSYPPQELTFTGGELGTMNEELLRAVIGKFKSANIKLKVVTNGYFLDKFIDIHLDMSSVGISINTENDMIASYDHILEVRKKMNLTTVMITNFGTHNIWNFHQLKEYAQKFDAWQVQATMGEFQLNKDGIKHLLSLLATVNTTVSSNLTWTSTTTTFLNNSCSIPKNKLKVVLADNLQPNIPCIAGINACSITFDGYVIACLSQRSYQDSNVIYGNMLEENLQDIWENSFKDIRFPERDCKLCRKCCKDYIEFPEIEKPSIEQQDNKIYPAPQGTYVYGVWVPVQDNNMTVAMYAVF
jgi:MoaA/NifB/PqqE/SkfB family radical SAM enzyme